MTATRNAIEVRKWVASKLMPREYGDAPQTVTVNSYKGPSTRDRAAKRSVGVEPGRGTLPKRRSGGRNVSKFFVRSAAHHPGFKVFEVAAFQRDSAISASESKASAIESFRLTSTQTVVN